MGDDASVQAKPRLSPAVPIGPGGGAPLGDLGDLGDLDLNRKRSAPVRALGGMAAVAPAARFPRTRGDGGPAPYAGTPPAAGTPFAGTPPGTALERKKSYHPDLRADQLDAGAERRGMLVLPRDAGHKMELIHLNRTCTSINLAAASAAGGAASPSAIAGLSPGRLRSASDANLTDEEKVHRVRHQVSSAQGVGEVPDLGSALQCEQLVAALRSRLRPAHQDDPSPTSPAALEDDSSDQEEPGDEDDGECDAGHLSCLRDNSGGLSPDSDADFLAVRPSLASTQLNEARGLN